MAYNIIEKHKGTIDVVSEVGKGTTFKISLQVEPDIVE
jgi:signal transduction histidine kinase